MHMLWTWGYTRAAIKLRAVVSIDVESIGRSDGGEGGEEDDARDSMRLSVRIRRSIDAGSAIALAGALLAAIGAQQVLSHSRAQVSPPSSKVLQKAAAQMRLPWLLGLRFFRVLNRSNRSSASAELPSVCNMHDTADGVGVLSLSTWLF
jgi:hypothetical protein